MLIDKGANPNTPDQLGNTPLHTATLEGLENMIALLLEKGGDPNKLNNAGYSPLHLAVISQSYAIVQLMLTYKTTIVDHENKQGNTALQLTFEKNDKDSNGIAALLTSYGADHKKLDQSNQSKWGALNLTVTPKKPDRSPSPYSNHFALYLAILGLVLITIGFRHKIWQGLSSISTRTP